MLGINYSNAVPLIAISVSLLAAACRSPQSGPPEIVVDRTACSHCGMIVSEPNYAAAYHAEGSEPRVFDDIACLIESIRRDSVHADASGVRMWYHDGNGGGWIDRGEPVFVSSPMFRTPMGGGVLAYRDVAAATKAASSYQGRVVGSLRDLINRKEGM